MINVNTNKTLNIILPNTNKALKEVLQSASPKELETLSTGKDLKSILNTLLKESSQNSAGDKTLLSLLKNNPTFKELGSITSSVKELLQTLKQDKNPLPLEKQLGTFLSDIKDISEKSLKIKIENSGILLESKLKNVQTPKVEIRELLNDLSKMMQDTKLPNVKLLNAGLKELLSSELFKNISNADLLSNIKTDLSSLSELSKKVQTTIEKFEQRINSNVDKNINPNDILFSKETKVLLDKISLLSKPEQLQNQTQVKDMLSQDLKAILLKTHEEISASNHPNKQELLKHMDKLSLQIDYHQLLSHLSNATSLYLPYSWDALEDGNITIKKAKENKFFTDIELQLKEYGELKLRLGMFEGNQLNINITAQSEELKNIFKENLPMLKQQLFTVGITPKEIRFLEDSSTTEAYTNSSGNLNMGFEVKA